jgi:hypothetical protein
LPGESNTALVLKSLRPKDDPAKPRSEGQRPLIVVGTKPLFSASEMVLVLMLFRPKDDPPKARSEG